MGAPFLISTK